MIKLSHFTKEIKKHNTTKYLQSIITRVNNGEGYCSILGKHVVFKKFVTGNSKKDKDRFISNSQKNIVSFNLK